MSEVANLHDRFFKAVFSREEEARNFLANYLPANVAQRLDLSTLEIQKDSFVDVELKTFHSDLLYRLKRTDGETAFVYIVFEHKSKPEPLIAFHLLRYMVKIWEAWLKQETPGKLPRIIPLTLYHGVETWHVGLRFQDLFGGTGEDLAAYTPDFSYALYNLKSYDDHQLIGIASLRLALWALKHASEDRLYEKLPEIADLLTALAKTSSGFEFLATVLRYIAVQTEPAERQVLIKTLKTTLSQKGENMKKSIYDIIAEEGYEKGIEKGIKKGLKSLRESILDIAQTRFEQLPPIISRFVNKCADEQHLRFLLKQAAVADSVEVLVHDIARLRTSK